MSRAYAPYRAGDVALDQAEATIVQIRASRDAQLVEVMAEAMFEAWQALMARPGRWAAADPADADVTRLAAYAALVAARSHALSRGAHG